MIHYNPSTILYSKSKTHLVDLQEYSIQESLVFDEQVVPKIPRQKRIRQKREEYT